MKTVLFLRAAQRGCWSQVINGASRYAREHGWTMLDVIHPIETENIRRFLNDYAPSGILVDSPLGRLPDGLRLCKRLPTVVHDPISIRISLPVFKPDQRRIGELAARELLSLGLRHFAYIEFIKPESWSIERGTTFEATVRKRGISFARFKKGSLSDFLLKLPKPAGIFAANDQIAQQVIAAASTVGLVVPRDIAVIGVDDEPLYCESTIPGISSIRTDREQVGYRFAELLDKLMTDPTSAPKVYYYEPTRIVRRGSTAPLSVGITPTIANAIEFIRRQACSPTIRIKDVVRIMQMPLRNATDAFKRATGHTILDEIHNRRFERMKEMLVETDTKISAIVNFCGYAADGFPKRMFLTRTGMTMREFRKTAKTSAANAH